jgi:hypothetical protein
MSFLEDLAKGNVIRGTVKTYFGNHEPKDIEDEDFFDLPDDSRWFGFVRVEDGREFFFHFNQGLELSYNIHLNPYGSTHRRVPQPGDDIIFNIVVGKRSDKVRANNWVFVDNLDKVQASIAKYKKFRIILKDSNPVKVIWEGCEEMLGIKFKEYVHTGLRPDCDALRTQQLLFQRMLEGGEWTMWEPHHSLFTNTTYVRKIKETTAKSTGKSSVKVIDVLTREDYHDAYEPKTKPMDFGEFTVAYYTEWMNPQGNWQKEPISSLY